MSRRIRPLLAILCLFFVTSGWGMGDTARVLSESEFLSIVRQYHPIVRSANLQVRRAEAGVRQARGSFDPVLGAAFSQKTLDGKNYYQYLNPEISIPTWYGLELLAGTEDIRGERVNPEATLGQLSYAGAKLDLNGILMDKRRAALRQAQVLRTQSLADRELAVNSLLYESLGAFYAWQRDAALLQIFSNSLKNARERMQFVRIAYEQGEISAIDTVEANAQIQNIELSQAAALLAYQNTGIDLSNYLWMENGLPLNTLSGIVPDKNEKDSIDNSSLEYFINSALGNHPKLASLQSKLDFLSIERQLKRSYLAPKLSVKGTVLSKGYSAPETFNAPYLENNSKVSAELRLPLFFREARGAYSAVQLKIAETSLDRDAQRLGIENKVRAAYNEVFSLADQQRKAQELLESYSQLYNGELIRFQAGESTLFILNSRQNKVIDANQKIVELKAKHRKAVASIYYAAGMLQ